MLSMREQETYRVGRGERERGERESEIKEKERARARERARKAQTVRGRNRDRKRDRGKTEGAERVGEGEGVRGGEAHQPLSRKPVWGLGFRRTSLFLGFGLRVYAHRPLFGVWA